MIIGIDLGTTNSLVATWIDGRTQIIPNALGANLTPSVVGIDDNGEVLVGQAARERMLTHPHLTASVFKRYMGTDRNTTLGRRGFRPEELSSLILRALKQDAEHFSGERVDEVVISVPAYFNDAQRKATKIAGELAGLKVERLINEPTAAALAYGLKDADPESQFLVFDLGGGTFDVTILELFEGIMEVRASAGDNFLGGEDFVTVIIDHFVQDVAAPAGLTRVELDKNPRLFQSLRREAEAAKCRLSNFAEARMAVRWADRSLEMTITASDLKTWSSSLLERIRTPVERALRDARIRPSQLKQILLVGGATRMPIIREMVTRLFGRFPSTEIHPDEAVALGAAVQAGLKARDAALREVVLTDVSPYSLGIEVSRESETLLTIQSGFFEPIIERNTVIPASRVQTFTTVANNQDSVELKIFQGESRLVRDNILLGKVSVSLTPKPKGEETVDVRFTYDINGILEVEAVVKSTGKKKTLVIEESPGVLSPDEIQSRLKSLSQLKIHPFDQVENRTLIARADRIYEQSLGTVRGIVQAQTTKFTDILSTQDPRRISKAREEFSKFLDSIESESPFSGR
jgi:molecular chaperone HscC